MVWLQADAGTSQSVQYDYANEQFPIVRADGALA